MGGGSNEEVKGKVVCGKMNNGIHIDYLATSSNKYLSTGISL